jgi:hypothetical protein
MLDLVRKFAALVLLLVIPLQGVATSSLAILQCPPVEAGMTYSSDSDDDSGNKSHDHVFCHQPVSGMPVIRVAGMTPDLPVFESSISLLSSLFLPEQPQRPPFSASA